MHSVTAHRGALLQGGGGAFGTAEEALKAIKLDAVSLAARRAYAAQVAVERRARAIANAA